MKLSVFRIKNFRSILDTGFKELSPDGISLIVGQNEAGKSSILEALSCFETGTITEDDVRSSGKMPEITCIFEFDNLEELTSIFPDNTLPKAFLKIFKKLNFHLAITRTWESGKYDEGILVLENEELKSAWPAIEQPLETAPVPSPEPAPSAELAQVMSADEFATDVFQYFPAISLFEDNSLLPRQIDLEDLISKNTKAIGYEGAKNFLTIVDLKPEDLKNPASTRIIDDKIELKNKKINADLQKYWQQTVGKKDKIEILLELKHHPNTVDGKQGNPYLMFWIRDKNGRLSPVQRSKGVKWFISFYLKLEATSKNGGERIFLIDEPGANLHAKAQLDILKVFEKQKDSLQIIFTTHSPYLLEVDKVYRVLAVERADTEDEKSETKLISFQDLGSASVDTLLPLYTNMGVDISHQAVISKVNNVLLEEISAFFYLKGFWKLFNQAKTANFLPATGCPNLPLLANLMLGWGLSYSVVVDDDAHGRSVYKELKDSKTCPENKLIKIEGCSGIEDIFSNKDFAKIVLNKSGTRITGKNSDYIKKQKISKVIVSRDFMLKSLNGKIKLADLSKTTQDNINKLLSKIEATLD